MSLYPQITDRNKPLTSKPLIRHPGLCCQGLGQMPVTFPTERRQDRLFPTRPKGKQILHLCTHLAPLLPEAHTDTSANPLINFWYGPVVIRDSKIVHPSPKVHGEFTEPVVYRDTPAPARKFTYPVTEVPEGLLRPAQLAPPEGESEVYALADLHNPALLLVDHQLEPGGQVPGDTGFDSLTCSETSCQDQHVIDVAHKPVSTSFKLFIEVVQHDVGQQRREWRTLWGSDLGCLNGVPDFNACPQIAANQRQKGLIAHFSSDSTHKHVVVDLVEELLKIKIHGNAIPLPDVLLYLPECSMGRTLRSGAETQPGKSRVEYRCKDLQNGLSNQPVEDYGDAEHPCSSPSWLGNAYPPQWGWLVFAIQQGLADRSPVLFRKGGKVFNAHSVNTRCTLVRLHLLPCPLHVAPFHDQLHEILVQGRLSEFTPDTDSPCRVHGHIRVVHGSSLFNRVRPFSKVSSMITPPIMASADFCPITKEIAPSRAIPLCCVLPSSLAPVGNFPGRPGSLINQMPPWSFMQTKHASHAGQISPDKNMDFQCTTAAFTLSPVPGGLCHVVLTRPETKPSMRFLFVSSHLCAQASFRPSLARPPLPSASSYFRPFGHYRYSYRGLPPLKSMPMSGVHKALHSDGNSASLHCRR
jgi:hypothetical protein